MTHGASLLVAAVVLVVNSSGQWFYFDEFEYLGSARDAYSFGEDLLRPHNEHWAALTGLTYSVLRGLVGLRSYWPYLIPVLLLHVMAAHLLWRLTLRLGSNAWVATGVAAVFAMVGAGYENVVWAFQLAFVTSTGCGLASALLVVGVGPLTARRRVGFIALSTLNLAISGVGVVWLVVGGLLLARRTGLRETAVTVAVPVSIYLTWSLLFETGTDAKDMTAWSFVSTVLQFAVLGLTSLGRRLIGIDVPPTAWSEIVGALVILTLAAAGWVRTRTGGWAAQQAALVALFAPIFFLVAASARVREVDGVANATASRYYYVAVVAVLPLVASLLTQLVESHQGLVISVSAGLAMLASLAALTYARGADGWREDVDAFHRTVLAEVDLLDSGAQVYPDNHPDPLMLVDRLSLADLRRWSANDEIARFTRDPVDQTTAALMLRVRIGVSDRTAVGCSSATGVVGPGAYALTFTVARRGVVSVVLTDEHAVVSRTRSQLMEAGTYSLSALVPGTVSVVDADGRPALCSAA